MKVKYKMTCMLPEIDENISIKLCQKKTCEAKYMNLFCNTATDNFVFPRFTEKTPSSITTATTSRLPTRAQATIRLPP